MGTHRKSNAETRKKKYANQFAKTEANKKKHLSLLQKLNPFYPKKKEKK